MEINEALGQIDAVIDEIENAGFVELHSIDMEWLEKARAALLACQELGGR